MKKKKILLLPKYTKKGPSSRYRLYQYIPILSEKYSVEVSPFFSDSYISQLLKGFKPSIFSALFSFIKRDNQAKTIFALIFIMITTCYFLTYGMIGYLNVGSAQRFRANFIPISLVFPLISVTILRKKLNIESTDN